MFLGARAVRTREVVGLGLETRLIGWIGWGGAGVGCIF